MKTPATSFFEAAAAHLSTDSSKLGVAARTAAFAAAREQPSPLKGLIGPVPGDDEEEETGAMPPEPEPAAQPILITRRTRSMRSGAPAVPPYRCFRSYYDVGPHGERRCPLICPLFYFFKEKLWCSWCLGDEGGTGRCFTMTPLAWRKLHAGAANTSLPLPGEEAASGGSKGLRGDAGASVDGSVGERARQEAKTVEQAAVMDVVEEEDGIAVVDAAAAAAEAAAANAPEATAADADAGAASTSAATSHLALPNGRRPERQRKQSCLYKPGDTPSSDPAIRSKSGIGI